MKRHLKRIGWVALTVACIWLWGIVTDSSNLREELLRLHVVGASNSEEDQAVKLQVRDAVLAEVTPLLEGCESRSEAETLVGDHLDAIADGCTVGFRKTAEDQIADGGRNTALILAANKEEIAARGAQDGHLPLVDFMRVRYDQTFFRLAENFF